MLSLVLNGELTGGDLQDALAAAGAQAQATGAYAFGEVRVAIVIGQMYFMRTNTHVGVAVVAATDGKTQRIDVAQAGGGQGLFGIEWGAGETIETKVYNAVGSLAQQRGISTGG